MAFITQPEDGVACAGSNHLFSVEADTSGFNGQAMSFSWYSDNGSGWQQITNDPNYYPDGAILNLYNIPASFDGVNYSCRVQIGAEEFESQSATLAVNVPAAVDFEAADFCFGDVTIFTNTSSEFNSFNTWHWGFDDLMNPDSVLTANAAHIFSEPGRYQVMLSGVDQNGCTSTTEKEIKIEQLPVPEINGPDIACSFQQNVKFDCNEDFSSYQWNIEGGQEYVNVVEGTEITNILTINCNQAFVPLQFDVLLNVSDQNGCSASVSKEFLMLKYKSPEKGNLIQKPENSRMLVCLLEESENKIYNWFVVENGTTNIVETFTTTENFIVMDDEIDTVTFEYGVEVIDATENNCSSSFYLNSENDDMINPVK